MAEEGSEVMHDPSEGVVEAMMPAQERTEERRLPDFTLKCIKEKRIPIVATVIIAALIITVIALAARKTPPCPRCLPETTSACPDGWVGFQGKCNYFSETERNWTDSQSYCSALNATLAAIDSLLELNFIMRYGGGLYRYIGLRREQGQGQPWKWTNGTIFNNMFEVRGEGQCAYLDERGVSSSRCHSERYFICSRLDKCLRRTLRLRRGDTMSKIT
ncbi:C-type lectin domain family 2 member D-like isoform X2 [Carettochelys insculpta]|uniref:C-type lectin domain family 2 member D-like isoform X2 n=1 Tax=Carettochelys insculpta TaxID=44489 RepID=UPI003EB80796